MLMSTVILGWIGVLMFFVILLTFQKLAKSNEYGFIHILMAFMYAMWLPLPISVIRILDNDILLIGAVFGLTYLVMLVITMTLQTGHIVHMVKQEQNKKWEDLGSYMMATLSSPFETLANVFKCLWAVFLAIAFWENGNLLMASLMILFSLLIFYFLIILLNSSLVKPIKFLSKVKPNPYLFNFETLLFFLTLMVYITRHI